MKTSRGAALLMLALTLSAPAQAASRKFVDVDNLIKHGPLPEQRRGSEAAPVTIVECALMTCGHCQAFNEGTFLPLKAKYVDTGKVRFILREFPLEPLAAAAFMLARCAFEPGGIDTMFTDLQRKLSVGDLIPATLVFASVVQLEVPFRVEPIGFAAVYRAREAR